MSGSLRITIPLLLLLLTAIVPCHTSARPTTYLSADMDTVIFRFVPGRLMFYSPYRGNDEAIKAMHRMIAENRDKIESGEYKVAVNGFCTSYRSRTRNLAAAKNRSNQVKSWFITHNTLVEDNYVTANHDYAWNGMGDVVAVAYLVRVTEPDEPVKTAESAEGAKLVEPREQSPMPEPEPTFEPEPEPIDSIPAEAPVVELPTYDILPAAEPVEPRGQSPRPEHTPRYCLALKTNLLYYLALTPNIELEWLIDDRWSVAVEGNLMWYGNYKHNHSRRLAVIDAEGRRWINPKAPWHGMFAGVFAGGGLYDFENGGKGHYGEGGMAGASFGYMWPVSRNISFEASLGVGYLYARDREYIPLDGHHVYLLTKGINYFGPLKLKFSVVWRFLDRNRPKPHTPAI